MPARNCINELPHGCCVGAGLRGVQGANTWDGWNIARTGRWEWFLQSRVQLQGRSYAVRHLSVIGSAAVYGTMVCGLAPEVLQRGAAGGGGIHDSGLAEVAGAAAARVKGLAALPA